MIRILGMPGTAGSRMRVFCRFSVAAALALISSCSMLPATETLEIYQLPASAPARRSEGDPLPRTLRLMTPGSSQMTDSARVLVLLPGGQMSSYKGIRWSDPAPVLLRNRLAAAFRADGRVASVSNGNTNLAAHLELGGDLGAFQVEYADSGPQATIRFYAILSQPLQNRIVGARSFEISQPVQSRGTPEIIAAFGIAADTLAAEIVAWTTQQGQVLQTAE